MIGKVRVFFRGDFYEHGRSTLDDWQQLVALLMAPELIKFAGRSTASGFAEIR